MSEENPARGTPEPKAAVIPAAPVASSLPVNQETAAVERAGKANSPADVRSLLSDLRKAKPAPAAEGKPAVAAAEPAPTETAAPEVTEETPASEETPAAEETETPAPEEGAETDDDDGGEGPISPITGKRTHLRLPENDQVGRLAASYMRRNRDMPMAEAMERAQKQLGIKPAGAAEPAAEPVKSDLPTTVEDVDAKLEQLIEEREKAMVGLYLEDANKIERSIRQLDRHRLVLERQAEAQQTKAAADYDAGFSASEKKAADLYAFVADPESKAAKRMIEIEAQLKDNDDPLYRSPDKPLKIAQMVAAELNIAPKKKGSPAAPAQAAAPANGTPAPKRQILPGGGSRTTPPASNPQQAVAEEVSKITNPHELRKFLKPLVGKR